MGGQLKQVHVVHLAVPAPADADLRTELKWVEEFSAFERTHEPTHQGKHMQAFTDSDQLREDGRKLLAFRGHYDMDALMRDAKTRAERQIMGRGKHPGGLMDLRVKQDYLKEQFTPVWAPVYLLRYSYGGRHYTVLINGQTGKLRGERPVALGRVFLHMIAYLLPAVILYVIGRLFPDWLVLENGFALVWTAFWVALVLGVLVDLGVLVYYTVGMSGGKLYQTYDPKTRQVSL